MTQLTLTECIEHQKVKDSIAEGERRRDKGMAAAEEHAPEDWIDAARRVVLAVANSLPRFTSDDVWAAGLVKPHEPRALGSVLRRLALASIIRKVGVRATAQASRNRGLVTEWERVP